MLIYIIPDDVVQQNIIYNYKLYRLFTAILSRRDPAVTVGWLELWQILWHIINMKNFHVPLPADLYNQLQQEAEQAHRPATQLARQAIADWIQQRQAAALHQAMAEYASRWAGTDADLDVDLEQAGVDMLLDENR